MFNGYPTKNVTPTEYAAKGVTIIRQVTRVAYARNGNVDNPTFYYQWAVYAAGKYVGTQTKFREAKSLADDAITNLEKDGVV